MQTKPHNQPIVNWLSRGKVQFLDLLVLVRLVAGVMISAIVAAFTFSRTIRRIAM